MSDVVLQWCAVGVCLLLSIVCELQHRTLKRALKLIDEAIQQRNDSMDMVDQLLKARTQAAEVEP